LDFAHMSWQGAVETTVTGLGYELVDAEKGAGGLLRVFIDVPPSQGPLDAPRAVTVDDCERVTRQLQHVLEVEGCAYERLEVSSPGLDRPLKKAADYARFVGEQVEVTLRLPFKGRKKYRGELSRQDAGWRLLLEAGAAPTRTSGRSISRSTRCVRRGWCRWSTSRVAGRHPRRRRAGRGRRLRPEMKWWTEVEFNEPRFA
jgi:ribosome maturation factor RimP